MLKEQSIHISRTQKIEDARKNCMHQFNQSSFLNSKKEKNDMEYNNKSTKIKGVLLFQFICAIVIFLFIFSSQKLGIRYEGIDVLNVKIKIQENTALEQLEETFFYYTQKLQIDKELFMQ